MTILQCYLSNKYPCLYSLDVQVSKDISRNLSEKIFVKPDTVKKVPSTNSWAVEPNTTDANRDILCETDGLEVQLNKSTQSWDLNVTSKLCTSACTEWLYSQLLYHREIDKKIYRINVEDAVCKAFLGFWVKNSIAAAALAKHMNSGVMTLKDLLWKVNNDIRVINCQCANVVGVVAQVTPAGFGVNGAEAASTPGSTWTAACISGPFLADACDCPDPVALSTCPTEALDPASPGNTDIPDTVEDFLLASSVVVDAVEDSAVTTGSPPPPPPEYTSTDNAGAGTVYHAVAWNNVYSTTAPTSLSAGTAEGDLTGAVFAEGVAVYYWDELALEWAFIEFYPF